MVFGQRVSVRANGRAGRGIDAEVQVLSRGARLGPVNSN
jgi:hypothetical protein